MPTYEYECAKCGHKFELFQSMKEKPIADCPKCSSPVKRLIGNGAGIIFKGHGFYATDYKSKKSEREPEICPEANKDNSVCKSCPAASDRK